MFQSISDKLLIKFFTGSRYGNQGFGISVSPAPKKVANAHVLTAYKNVSNEIFHEKC